MKSKEFKEFVNTILTAKLTDFCGEDTYQTLTPGDLFSLQEDNPEILNYTFRDFIEIYSKIAPTKEEIDKKLPGEENFKTRVNLHRIFDFKRMVYFYVLRKVFVSPTGKNLYIVDDKTANIIGRQYLKRNTGSVDPHLSYAVKELMKMKVIDFLGEIGSLCAGSNSKNIIQLAECYLKIRAEVEQKDCKDIKEIMVGDVIVTLGDFSHFSYEGLNSRISMIENLILIPFSIASGLTLKNS